MTEYRVLDEDNPIIGKPISKEEAVLIMVNNERLFNERMSGKVIDPSQIKTVCVVRK